MNLFEDKPVFKIDRNKKVRFISLFSGIGFQELGLKYLGVDFEYHKAIEFDKYAVEAYNAVHGTDIKVTDVTKVKGEDLEIVEKDKYTYLLTYSYPCFVGNTLVLTKNGYKKIEDVVSGDYVLTHDNTYQKVLDSRRTGKKNIFNILNMGTDEIKCTENHLFYVREMYRTYPYCSNGKRGNVRHFEEPVWKECKYLTKKDYLGIAINTNSNIPEWNGVDFEWEGRNRVDHSEILKPLMNNPDFWWIMGYYVGDGWQRSQGGIELCGNEDKIKEVRKHLDAININYCIHLERTCYRCSIGIKEIGEFVKIFGKYADGKYIPSEVLDLPIELAKAFLEGYTRADGYKKGNKYKISSVSRTLIYGTAQLVAKVYHRPYSIYKNKRPKTTIIEGRVVNQKDGYELVWKTTTDKQDKAFYENGYIWIPVYDVIDTNQLEDVYDITVENSHSFTANGIIAHNCTDLSIAGAQLGMSKGSGTRSGLLWEVERLLNETKELPDILIMENVTQVHGKKFIKDFEQWIEFLKSKGYSNYWQDMNCLDFGVPQSRNRCFMVSILGDYSFEFPETKDLEMNLEDVLIDEDKIESKFYYNSEKTQKLVSDMLDKGELPYAESNYRP